MGAETEGRDGSSASLRRTASEPDRTGGGVASQKVLPLGRPEADRHPSKLLQPHPAYTTDFGAMFQADSSQGMAAMPDESVDIVVTSPPYALHFKKEYGNADKEDYVEWFRPFGQQIFRILKPEGSFVLNIGGSYEKGRPTRSLYHFHLLLMLCEDIGFCLAQECFWYNPAKLPSPAEWVNVRRIRIKDSVEYVFWLSKTPFPYADNRQVLEDYSDDMRRIIARGYKTKRRPSGHNITDKFQADRGGSIPSNVLMRGNNESNSQYIRLCAEYGIKPHPARFPSALPEFYIKFLTRLSGLVVDPFAGSNTTGAVAESLHRQWLAFETEPKYVENSKLRFGLTPGLLKCSQT